LLEVRAELVGLLLRSLFGHVHIGPSPPFKGLAVLLVAS
jgi:hypothetical protein